MSFTVEDLQSYCDDLSRWILDLGLVDEIKIAFPKGEFPLTADEEDLEEGLDVLLYLTLWMSIKSNQRAPDHIESRIMFSERTKGPWKHLYSKLWKHLYSKLCTVREVQTILSMEDLWELAS